MKKYITLFTFVCVLFLGMQTATAQEVSEDRSQETPELRAKSKTLLLNKKLGLTDQQVRQVYKIYLSHEKNAEEVSIALVTKQISNLLLPEQREGFMKIAEKDMYRARKLERARTGDKQK
ncbi:MAG: hypothetical protein AAF611_03675 [Bacteroidota bacterium]